MTTVAPQLRALAPAVVARLGSLELRARAIVDGAVAGLHRSPHRGFSVEFAEYRPYLPGDDLATIDWKVYARSDRYCVRRFDAETTLQCHVLLDVSRSMAYGSGAVSKFVYAQGIAAALALFMQRQRDASGLIAFDEAVVDALPPSSRPGHLQALFGMLERLSPGRGTHLADVLERLAASHTRRGLVVLISDLLDDPARVVRALTHFHVRGSEVAVLQLLDPHELDFPFDRDATFEDLESGALVTARPGLVRETYLAAMAAMTRTYREAFGSVGIDYYQVRTDTPMEHALLHYMTTRARVR